jgi:catechol 2,3-dioxygenase-like lactoylglutathione lyase family enzyme
MALGHVTPVLRIFDEEKAVEFYVDFLGFRIDWQHRYADDFPIYMGVSKDACVLHLTGHHGDACPGTALRITVTGLDQYQAELMNKHYKHARPGIEVKPWGRDMTIADPFGNRLTFSEAEAV